MNQDASAAAAMRGGLDTTPQRVLAIGGLLAIVTGMLFGDVFAVFVLHPNNGRIGQAMYEAAQLIPSGDPDRIMARFTAIGGFLENRGTKVDAHSHLVHMGYIALLLAMLQPWIAFSHRSKRTLAWLYVLSTFLLASSIFTIHYVGLAYSPLTEIGWASILADTFGLLLGIAVLISLWGLWRHFRGAAPPVDPPAFMQHDGTAARTLLVGGLLLLVWGFLYGAGYAAWGTTVSPDAEVGILKDIVSHAAAGDTGSLNAAFAAFGDYQLYRAINVASHTHINEMGILLLLLAFMQPFVYYPDARKRAWARVAVVGGFGLPIGILLELTSTPMLGSIIADLSGLTAIFAVTAMLFGVLRFNGVRDSELGASA